MRDDQTTSEVFRESLLRVLSGTCVSGPGLVRSVSGDTAEVVPMVNRIDEEGVARPYSPIPNVSVLKIGGAGWEIDVSPSAGDIVWLFFADGSLDEWRGSKSVVTPQSKRSHALTDAVALPLNFGGGAGGTLRIRNTSGTVSAEFAESGITLNGSVDVTGLLRVGTASPATAFTVNTHTHIETGGTTNPPTPGS